VDIRTESPPAVHPPWGQGRHVPVIDVFGGELTGYVGYRRDAREKDTWLHNGIGGDPEEVGLAAHQPRNHIMDTNSGTARIVRHSEAGDAPMAESPVNLSEKLAQIQEYWDPHIVGELNGQHVKLAKVKGDFIWHSHQNEDELFLVLEGVFRLELRDGVVTLKPGEIYIVPRGVEHRPVAEEEVHLLMFEPASTLNTGNVKNERTVDKPQRI
jgi:mannose-6-phosphate isomerase-like protein (cupin superfamily)